MSKQNAVQGEFKTSPKDFKDILIKDSAKSPAKQQIANRNSDVAS